MLKRLFKESLIYGLSRYIGKFIGIFLLPLYTAMLTPADYGILDLLGTITVVSSYLIVSGTDSALSYYYYRKEYFSDRPIMISTSLWIRIIFSLLAFLVIALISNFLSGLIFGRDYSLFIIITGLTIVFGSIYSFLFDLVRFEFRPWFYTVISTGGILLQILLNVYLILILKKGVYGALVANALAYFFFFAVSIIYVFNRYKFGFSKIWAANILKYGSPLIITGIAVWILNSTDRYFLAHYMDLTQVGIYAVGMKLASFLGMISGTLQLAWAPFALDIQYHDDAKKIYAKVFLIYFILNIIGVFLISMFSIDILKVFTQPAYYSAKAVVPFLCMSVVFWSGYFLVGIGMGISKKAQHTVWITILAAALNIALNFILIPLIGAVGTAFSIMMANLLVFILTLIVSQRLYYISYPYLKALYLFLPAAVIVAYSYYTDSKLLIRLFLSLIYLIFAFVFLYQNYKDSPELKRAFEKIKSFRWRQQAEETKIEI